MRSLLTRSRDESGQVLAFVAGILVLLVGMAALVVDVGYWYQAQRQTQTAVDAGALAGVQELKNPATYSKADPTARQYARDNFARVSLPLNAVKITDDHTIDVDATAPARGIFAPVIVAAFEPFAVHAHAQAQIQTPKLKWVLPIAVHKDYACTVPDTRHCFGEPFTLNFDDDDPEDPTGSKFGLMDLDLYDNPDCADNGGARDIADWVEFGSPCYLPVDEDYEIYTGNKNGIKDELGGHVGDKVLIPIFDGGSTTTYHVIGWAAFVIDEIVGKWTGNHHVLKGHFETVEREDLDANGGTPGGTDFGVPLIITLTE